MAYKDNQYWKPKQDEDMRIIFTTPNNSKAWLQAYRRILPRLRKMGGIILKRYYFCPNNQFDDIITDSITTLIINGEYNPDKPKMFAYCGTIMKHYFYDKLVYPKQWSNTIDNNTDKNYDINDNEWLAEKYHIEANDEFDISLRQEQLQIIFKICDIGIANCNEIEKRNNDKNIESEYGKVREKQILIYAKEYFETNFIIGTVSILALADYINARVSFPDYVVSRYLRQYFNAGSCPHKIDNKTNSVDWVTQRGASSYLMDDDCPNEIGVSRYRKQKMKKNNNNIEYNYF